MGMIVFRHRLHISVLLDDVNVSRNGGLGRVVGGPRMGMGFDSMSTSWIL